MAMLTWEVWDLQTPGSKPEGLLVQRADFLTVSDTASSGQTPHMQAVVVPQWDVALAVHRNAYDYHMKVFGGCLLTLLGRVAVTSYSSSSIS